MIFRICLSQTLAQQISNREATFDDSRACGTFALDDLLASSWLYTHVSLSQQIYAPEQTSPLFDGTNKYIEGQFFSQNHVELEADAGVLSGVVWERSQVCRGRDTKTNTTLSPWIWKGVSTTWQSGRYTLLYPRGQHNQSSRPAAGKLPILSDIHTCARQTGRQCHKNSDRVAPPCQQRTP